MAGGPGQLEADAAVAEEDEPQGEAEAHTAGQQEEVRQHGRPIQVEVLHAGVAALGLLDHLPAEQRRRLEEDYGPHQTANTPGRLHLPQAPVAVRVHHGQVAVQADAGHEGDARVRVGVEEHGGDAAQRFAKGPIKLADVVGDASGQRQGEEGVGHGQVHQVDRGGVELLAGLTGDEEHQAVAQETDDEDNGVEDGEDDVSHLFVGENITG